MALHTPPDLAGDGAVHNLGTYATDNGYTAPVLAREVQLTVSGSGTCRVGDEFTSASRGLPIPASGGIGLQYIGRQALWDLGGLYVYVPSGATLSIGWEY